MLCPIRPIRDIKVVDVIHFAKMFKNIDSVNYEKIIFVFDEEFTDEGYDLIFHIIHDKWNVNKLYRIHDDYDNHHSLIHDQVIFVENCDIQTVDDAKDLFDYLYDGYEIIFVANGTTIQRDFY